MTLPAEHPDPRAVPVIHPPHRESWDVATGVTYMRDGTPRELTACEETEFGLFFARPLIGHPRLAWVASWLLPSVGLRISDFRRHPGVEPATGFADRDVEIEVFEDYYIDVGSVERDGPVWRTTDYYLDLFVWTGRHVHVIDLDEFVAAVATGHLDAETAERALRTSFRTQQGITAHGHDVNAWLAAAYDIHLTWPGAPRLP